LLFLFIFALVVTITGVALLRSVRIEGTTYQAWKGGIPLAIVGVLLMGVSTVRVVPPRSVGIEITLGKVTDAYNSGLHVTLPWAKVENYPATIQTTKLQGQGTARDEDGPCVTVRLGNQTTACVNVTAQWVVNTQDTEAVKKLYTQWRSFDNIEPKLIRPRLEHALLAPFQTYDPLEVLKANGQLTAPTTQFEKVARDTLSAEVGNGITISALTINLIGYDSTTQDKINAYSQAVADTRIAEQRKLTADAQRQANEALAGSAASRDSGVLLQNCLDTTERLTKEGKALPAGWTCFGNAASPVVSVR